MKKYFKKYAIALLSLMLIMLTGTVNNVNAEEPEPEKIAPVTDLRWSGGANIEYQLEFTPVEDEDVKEYKVVAHYSLTGDTTDMITEEATITNNDAIKITDLFVSLKPGYYWAEVITIASEESGKANSEPATIGATLFNELTLKIKTLDEEGQEITSDTGGALSYGHDGVAETIYVDKTFVLLADKEYTIFARPYTGYAFKEYTGDLTGSEASQTISLNTSKTITGVFQENNDTVDLVFEIGANHEDLATKVKNYLVEQSYVAKVEGSKLTLTWLLNDDLYNPISKVDAAMCQVISDEPLDVYVDNGEEYEESIGRMSMQEYKNEDEYNTDLEEIYNLSISDVGDKTLYVHWAKRAEKISLTIEKPICGQEASYNPPVNQPKVDKNKDSHLEINKYVPLYWCDEEEQPIQDNFTFVADGETTYNTFVQLMPAFGYYIDPDYTIQSFSVENSANSTWEPQNYRMLIGVKAEHDWKFKDITWSTNHSEAKANYVCAADETHTKSIECEVTQADSEDGKSIVSTASISAEKSPDGKEHSDQKTDLKYYNLYVQGVHVNANNCEDILGNGTVKYDPESNVLTLNNAEIEVSRRQYGDDSFEYGIRIFLLNADDMPGGVSVDGELKIELIGNNKIVDNETSDGAKAKYGIQNNSQSKLSFVGDGTLDITINSNTKRDDNEIGNNGIDVRNALEIDGPIINVNTAGEKASLGLFLRYSNRVTIKSGELHLVTDENGIAFYNDRPNSDDLEVYSKGIFEAISPNKASEAFSVTSETKELGALVNNEASLDGAEVWDKQTDLNTYKYIRIPEAQTLTIKWSSIDGDDLMEEIKVVTRPGKTISEITESIDLFEKEGYEPFGIFLDKSMSNYTSVFIMKEDDISKDKVNKDMTVYYPMIKIIKEVNLTLNPIEPGSETTTPKVGDVYELESQTNKPSFTYPANEGYRLLDNDTIWVEDYDALPLVPFIGTFNNGTYKGITILLDEFGYKFADDVKYNIDGATYVKNVYKYFIHFTAEVGSIKYRNTQGNGNEWQKGSADGSQFTFKRSVNDNESYSRFTGIKVDGQDVPKSKYTYKEGSVIITLKPEYLETLSVGEHTITALFDDGSASAKFYIIEKASPSNKKYPIPKTGIE